MSEAATPGRQTLTLRTQSFLLALLSSSIAINLVDRQSLSVVAPVMRGELHLSNTQYGYILVAFQLGMFLGQVPAGAFMDRLGTRLGLALAFTAWSFVNASHALAGTLGAFIGLRFLMGITECGNYTGGIKAIASLFPPDRRAFCGGIFNAGAQLGSVIAPPLIVWITLQWGWRMAFVLPSILSLVWLAPWLAIYPRKRVESRQDSAAAAGVRIADLIRNRKVFGFFMMRLFSGPLVSFYWYWLPEYLKTGRKMPYIMVGLLAWLPGVFGALGNIAGGYLSDRLRRRFVVDHARKIGFTLGLGLSALSMTMPLFANDALAIAIICLVVFGNNCTAATYIGSVGEIFPPNVVGRVNGIAGAGDSLGGMISMLLTGILVDRYSYFPVFIGAGILPLLALACVFLIVRRIEPLPEQGDMRSLRSV